MQFCLLCFSQEREELPVIEVLKVRQDSQEYQGRRVLQDYLAHQDREVNQDNLDYKEPR